MSRFDTPPCTEPVGATASSRPCSRRATPRRDPLADRGVQLEVQGQGARPERRCCDGGGCARRRGAGLVERGHAHQAAQGNPAPAPKTDEAKPHADELKAYLALPQIENSSEWAGLDWWKENEKYFPNLAVMARQYFGCPATSATVERLFSAVGIAFSKLRKSSKAETLSNIAFTNLNVE